MKHCYTDCIVKYDDEYRTRYDCKICNKSFYQLKDRTSKVESNDSLIAGKILLKNGTPYITCGNRECNQVERLHDSRNIRIFLKWEEMEEGKYVWINGVRTVQKRYKLVSKTVRGCSKCANFQDHETQRLGRNHYYNLEAVPVSEPKVEPLTTKYAPKPIVAVIPYRFPTSGPTKVQTWGSVREQEKVNVQEGLYGPYQDRKGK